ncbi:MAG: 3-keto-5-aminohexanoate cleavage protein [Saprospiraceae bacterium]|nr:3-keto-5-aminohexanoate cleavage protein [Saprospiraceae bacterium]
MQKFILNFTPTGMIPTKEHTPHIPVSPTEIVDDVLRAHELGITLVHLHARDELGVPTYKVAYYAEIIEKIRKYAQELVLCVSLSGRNFNEFEKRSEVLSICPDMGSLTLSSLNFSASASVNSPDMITNLALAMNRLGVKPELEVFDLGMINYAHYLIKKDILKPPFYFNIITGNVAGIQPDPDQLGVALRYLPADSYWALGGIGPSQLNANMMALSSGGGVRVGLEDNIFYDLSRSVKATNVQLIQRIHAIADILERPLMTSSEFGNLGFYNINRSK